MAAAGATNVGDIEEDASQLSFPKGGFRRRTFLSVCRLTSVYNRSDPQQHRCNAICSGVILTVPHVVGSAHAQITPNVSDILYT